MRPVAWYHWCVCGCANPEWNAFPSIFLRTMGARKLGVNPSSSAKLARIREYYRLNHLAFRESLIDISQAMESSDLLGAPLRAIISSEGPN